MMLAFSYAALLHNYWKYTLHVLFVTIRLPVPPKKLLYPQLVIILDLTSYLSISYPNSITSRQDSHPFQSKMGFATVNGFALITGVRAPTIFHITKP